MPSLAGSPLASVHGPPLSTFCKGDVQAMDDRADLIRKLEFHTAEAARLREQIAQTQVPDWRPTGFYTTYHFTAGAILGCLAASVSLLWNVMGAALLIPEKPPLYLIQVFLTFGLGERALTLEPGQASGFLYFVGCLLYIATGGFYGIILQFLLQGLFASRNWVFKAVVSAAFGLGIWILNFYLILPVIQPMLFNGNWIYELTPWFVGASTHIVFAAAFFLISTWGRFEPPALSPPSAEPRHSS